jgi:OOP family OmpA-OmpF porin
MKTNILLLGVASLALAGAANAAHFQGWYISLEAGVSVVQDADADNDTIDPTFLGGFAPTTASFETGWAGMMSLGKTWGDWRTELELGFRKNDLDTFDVEGTSYTDGGTLEEFSAMVNLVYDWQFAERWSLALGGGVGADQMHYDNNSGFHTVDIQDTEWTFAWQLIAGLNYELSERSVLFVNYRYFNATDPEFTEVDFGGDLHNDTYDDFNKHAVTIGWRYDLIQDETPMVAAPPPAPEPPPPPPPARNFEIYFGSGKCSITSEADVVLGEAADAAKAAGGASIVVVGHTDTAGANAANQKLSQCRADAAKSNLIAKGVPADRITATGRGESEPRVQTADGVREPQNNRVTIELK